MLFSKKAPHLKTGERGEKAALWHLRMKGYRILGRNYRCPLGEIDIIASRKGIIVFVEVRTRQAGAMVDPLSSIDDLKLAHFMDAARHYLTVCGHRGVFCRFDIITVSAGGFFRGRIRHYENAFRTTDERPSRGQRLNAWKRRQPRPGGRAQKKPLDKETMGRGNPENDR
jgi:putative endonuclease